MKTIDIGRTDNQMLAALWLADTLRDTRDAIIKATTQREVNELVGRISDVLRQADEIMGPEVRAYANELRLHNPFGAIGAQL